MSEETDCELCYDGTFDIWECPSCCRKIVESRPESRQELRWPENIKNVIEQVLRDKIMIIEEHHHSYYGSPQELIDLLVNACHRRIQALEPGREGEGNMKKSYIEWPEERTGDRDSPYLEYDRGYNHGLANCLQAYNEAKADLLDLVERCTCCHQHDCPRCHGRFVVMKKGDEGQPCLKKNGR